MHSRRSRCSPAVRAFLAEKERAAVERDVDHRIFRNENSEVRTYLQGGLIELVVPAGYSAYESENSPIRGQIDGFSPRSRRRMMVELNKVRRDVPLPLFLTLTYPKQWPGDWKTWKGHLNHFAVALRRAYPGVSAFWKIEPQERGAPHFHLLCWGASRVPWQWLAARWASIIHGVKIEGYPVVPGKVGARLFRAWARSAGFAPEVRATLEAGTRVEEVRTWNGVASYASKYLGKSVEGFRGVGRFWGIIGRKDLPRSACHVNRVPLSVAIWVKRFIRRSLASRGVRIGNGRTAQLFTVNFTDWLRVFQLACDLARGSRIPPAPPPAEAP
jgi:hypothetical protein